MADHVASHACEKALVFSVNIRVNSAASRALGFVPAVIIRAVRWAMTWGEAQASSRCWRATDLEECFLGMDGSSQQLPRRGGAELQSRGNNQRNPGLRGR